MSFETVIIPFKISASGGLDGRMIIQTISDISQHKTPDKIVISSPTMRASLIVYVLNILLKFRKQKYVQWIPSGKAGNFTLRPRQNGRHFPDDIFKCIFLNENA